MHAHDHTTDHDHGSHAGHRHHTAAGRVLIFALVLTGGFAIIEAVGGWLANSLALMGDAGHMVTDAVALGLAAVAAAVARRPASAKWSYGLGRAEVVAALVNGLFMLALVGIIVSEAIGRLGNPAPVSGGMVILIALAGLIINLVVAYVLSRGEKNLNTRGAMLHVMGDLLGSVAALVAGIVIWFTGWTPIDPILSIAIAALIVYSSLSLLWDSLRMIMEGVPPGLRLDEVGAAMATADARVSSVHDLHIWALSSDTVALSAHVVVSDFKDWDAVLAAECALLEVRFGITHVTLQPERPATVTVPVPGVGAPPERL